MEVLTEHPAVWLLDFSGIYRKAAVAERIFSDRDRMVLRYHTPVKYLDLRDIQGTNCYCDDTAAQEIRKRIYDIRCGDIRLLDSGNYHYMSRILAEKAEGPFQMIVLDNHTDMQPPAFGGLLSCGGWVFSVLEDLPDLTRVILYGPPAEDIERLGNDLPQQFRSRVEALYRKDKDSIASLLLSDLPLYISIDKDIISMQDILTNWNQGDLRLSELKALLSDILRECKKRNIVLTGTDLCGGPDRTAEEKEIERSLAVDMELIEIFTEQEAVLLV